eukprot:scaffold58728_cov52-Attheya_sp.AAC.1
MSDFDHSEVIPSTGKSQDREAHTSNNIDTNTVDDDDTDRPVKYEGILFKRRDIFKKKWRPRLFVLDGAAGTLTYYLLTSEAAVATTDTVEASHDHSDDSPTHHQLQLQDVEYDVVPRGIVSLSNCCTVHVNDEQGTTATSPDSHLFCFTIAPLDRSNSTAVHLASTTAEGRSEWVQRIAQVCGAPIIIPELETTTTTTTTTATPATMTATLTSSQEEQDYASISSSIRTSTSLTPSALHQQQDQTTQDETETQDDSAGFILPIHEN